MYFGLAPQDGSTFTNQLAIASTGAATFSSSVQADGGSNGFLINQNGGAAGLATYSANTDRAQIAFKYAQNYPASNNYTRVLDIVSTGDATGTGIIRLLTSYNGQNPSAALTLLAGGAATFSSLAGISSRTVTADASGTLSASSDSSLKQEDTSHKIEGLADLLQLINLTTSVKPSSLGAVSIHPFCNIQLYTISIFYNLMSNLLIFYKFYENNSFSPLCFTRLFLLSFLS
ncbi:hypothetical protein CCP3SC1AL1_3990002 [Gammaproteobacteria bacterium]